MRNTIIGICPICGGEEVATELKCKNCDTTIRGEFVMSIFDRLSDVQTKFLLVYLKNDGNIKQVEKELNISYPTVKKIYDEIKSSLNLHGSFNYKEEDVKDLTRKEVLEKLHKGEISFDEAEELLKD